MFIRKNKFSRILLVTSDMQKSGCIGKVDRFFGLRRDISKINATPKLYYACGDSLEKSFEGK